MHFALQRLGIHQCDLYNHCVKGYLAIQNAPKIVDTVKQCGLCIAAKAR